MNVQQQKYALERVSSINKRLMSELRNKHTTPAIKVSGKEQLKLIKQGKVKFNKSITEVGYYTKVEQLYDFSKFKSPEKLDEKKYKPESDKLRVKYDQVRDEIVLGDEEQALKLIQAFSK